MRKMFNTAITATLAMLLLGMGFVSRASAQCGVSALSEVGTIQLQSWEGVPIVGTASFLQIADHGPGIVGFWKVKFVAEGNTGGPPTAR